MALQSQGLAAGIDQHLVGAMLDQYGVALPDREERDRGTTVQSPYIPRQQEHSEEEYYRTTEAEPAKSDVPRDGGGEVCG